ncbi:corrinoid protein [Pelolinea submarina]|uniref:5-methyltetrahydrofolate--homocysteine methyltransferase n=1 Tax=Pelolinea submarina TaxID=913107 RepID=A0A347ZPP4_9CHLR|nr:corrinoid protein [Pelolinea submarina]REG04710.1 5-methyltetrahydrofolate--homocysteine methyltransferase [Pelolinea submarina]BBB47275.1 5-methyltetrahydrofolate--homocysteine methyltransferase [Pelolinea submarina]
MSATIQEIYTGVVEGDRDQVVEAVQQALNEGDSAETILKQGMMAAMGEVGRLFEEGEYFVPELLVAARAMQGGMDILRPLLVAEDVEPVGKIVIGTVKGDLHDIGKNLVSMMMQGAGFEVTDLGTDVAPEKFVDAVKTSGANLVAMSALLTTTMANMPATIAAFDQAGIRDKVKIMIGGAPVTDQFAQKIGADGYAPDANQAARLALSLIA